MAGLCLLCGAPLPCWGHMNYEGSSKRKAKAKPEDIVKCFDFDAVVYCKICGEEIHYPSVMPPEEYVFDHLYKHVSKLYGKRKPAVLKGRVATPEDVAKAHGISKKQLKELTNVLKGKDDSNRRKHKSRSIRSK
jgi:hypothetical protein